MNNFVKQPQQLTSGGNRLNGGSGDSVVGGVLTGVPAGIPGASQGGQTQPGDRFILGFVDALALSNTTVGTLYGGLYMYVSTYASATAAYTINRLVFWNFPTANDNLYQVTSDEGSLTTGAALIAGVLINTLTAGNYWWIQIAGKVAVKFRSVLTGTPSSGCAVYAAGAGAGAQVGTFDVLDGGGNPTFTQLGLALNRYSGVADAIPVAGAVSNISMPLSRLYRF